MLCTEILTGWIAIRNRLDWISLDDFSYYGNKIKKYILLSYLLMDSLFCFYCSAESLKLSADICVCFFGSLNVQQVSKLAVQYMAQWTKKIWVCYLPLGWSEYISMPAYFFPFSLSRPILFSFKHTCLCFLLQMHQCVNASWILTSLFLRKLSVWILQLLSVYFHSD